MADLVFSEKIVDNKDAFLSRVSQVSSDLNIDPNWLMAVMNSESSLNSKAINSTTKATGLIQFMPSTASSLGTTVQDLYNMSNVNQLDYVYKYLLPYKGKMQSYIDVYTAVFFPAAIGKPDDYVLQTDTISAATIAKQNKIFDVQNRGFITVSDLKTAFLNRIPSQYQVYFTKGYALVKEHPLLTAGITTVIIFSLYFLVFGGNRNN